MLRALIVGLIAIVAVRASAIDITQCDTTVPEGEIGDLRADLSCAGAFVGVRLLARATLRLNDHTISGTFQNDGFYGSPAAVLAYGRNRIQGPGRIAPDASSTNDVAVLARGAKLRDVDLVGGKFGILGVPGDTPSLNLKNVTITDALDAAIALGRVRASNVTITGGGTGLSCNDLRAKDFVTTGHAGYGLYALKVTAKRLTATGNSGPGVRAVTARLSNSVVTGNGPPDLLTSEQPRLVLTTCGTSAQFPGPGTWGVCTND